MNIRKVETNYKRNMFFQESLVNPKSYLLKLENQIINIYPSKRYQSILGFGGAFTEAASYSYNALPESKKEQILQDYFSENGLNYSIGRLSIGSSDFSKKSYSYSHKESLSDFSIEKDKEYIIPFIKKAQEINPNIQFLSSPWSPPKFMKSNKMLVLGGKLLAKYKNVYANYLVKYIKSYNQENIKINYITVQNEPNATQIWESCIFTDEEEADFAVNYLYPALKDNNIETKIIIWDHNKEKLYSRSSAEFSTTNALSAMSGVAFHWYSGDHFENIRLVAEEYPEKLLIHTEGCTGYSHFNPNDEVHNAEIYAHDILGDLNAGINAYIDWNLILDNKGGPNHKLNYCNSPIMLNHDSTDYIKNLTYYYIGHFSRFIKPGSRRIAFSRYTDEIEVTSFINTDNSIAIILLNRNNYNKEYNLCINNKVIHDNLDSHAIVSYLIEE